MSMLLSVVVVDLPWSIPYFLVAVVEVNSDISSVTFVRMALFMAESIPNGQSPAPLLKCTWTTALIFSM